MPPEESLYPDNWLQIAEKDMTRVRQLLDLKDAEAAGFFLQQAVEKFLKAYLLTKDWEIKRIHDLEVLLNDALVYDPAFESFREACQKISGFYMVERYPMITESEITEEDIQDTLSQIIPLTDRIRDEINPKIDNEEDPQSDSQPGQDAEE